MARLRNQLWIPGFEPTEVFEKHYCGDCDIGDNVSLRNLSEDCDSPASILAIRFKMGQYNEDDGVPELVGYDCPFDDSDCIYACGPKHLAAYFKKMFDEEHPDVIVDNKGNIRTDLYNKTMVALETRTVSDNFFTQHLYSKGKESAEQLWEREKWRFGF